MTGGPEGVILHDEGQFFSDIVIFLVHTMTPETVLCHTSADVFVNQYKKTKKKKTTYTVQPRGTCVFIEVSIFLVIQYSVTKSVR